MAIIGAAVAGLASALGNIFSSRSNAKSVDSANRFNERMSSTAWQRGVEDMRMAGLNPMLAYSQGPASSPSGLASSSNFDIGGAVNSAVSYVRTKKELELMDQNIKNAKWMEDNIRADSNKKDSEMILNQKSADRVSAETALAISELPRAQNLAKVEEGRFGEVMSYVDRLMSIFGLGTKALRR